MKKNAIFCLLISSLMTAMLAMPAVSAALQTTWEYETPLLAEQTQSVFVADRDSGNIYIIGGGDGVIVGTGYKKTSDNVTVYDVATGESHHLAPLPTGVRAASGGLGEDGRIYVFGGYNDTLGATQSATQIYDIATDTWTTGASMPTASSFTSCAVDWPKFYVIGGTGGGWSVQIYSATTNSWSSGPSLPVSRIGATAVFNEEDYAIYLIGGSDWFVSAVDTVYKFVIWGSAWVPVSPLPAPRAAAAATIGEDGLIYLAGGSNSALNVVGEVYADAFCYNPVNDTWFSISSLNVPRKYLGLISMNDGRIFSIGGNDETTIMSTVESLKPVDATIWLTSASVQQGGYLVVNLDVDSAYAMQESSDVRCYIKSSTGIVYPWNWREFPAGIASLPIAIPESMPVGSYELYVHWVIEFETDGDWELDEVVLAFSVVAKTDISQQLDDLQNRIDDLQNRLNALNDTLSQRTEDISDQVSNVGNELEQVGESTGDATNAANSANMMATLAMILALIAVILIALNLAMSMRKKS